MEKILPLYDICLNKISEILVECRGNVITSTSENPFRVFPPTVVHDLIPFILRNLEEKKEYLKCSYLYLLLISGRITSLKLTDVMLQQEDAEEIFNCLQPYSEKLKSIKISSFNHCPQFLSSNFGTVVHSANNLVSLETSINFNLSELSHCKNLEKLVFNCKVTDLTSFLYVDGEMRHNHSLKMLRILSFKENEGLCFDIADILQYCVEIVEIDYNIAPSLMYLHEIQKATKYKLQKTRLGESKKKCRIPSKVVRIASLYCPELRTVHSITSGYAAVKTFSNFSQITKLTLKDPKYDTSDYLDGVRLLLENSRFGHNLKSLVLADFYAVDFAHIGACCPNLEELGVEYFTEYTRSRFIANSFQKLISLSIKISDMLLDPCEARSFIGILSKATFLEFLKIDRAENFDDNALDVILKNTEAFSRLKTLNVNKCGLSIHGFKKLVQSLVSVQFILYSSPIIGLEDVEIFLKSMGIARYNLE